MSVYVDPQTNYGWKLGSSCHMWADTEAELHTFAASIGLKRVWFQHKKDLDGYGLPHYDLTTGRRLVAVKKGAIQMDMHTAFYHWIKLGYQRPLDRPERQELPTGSPWGYDLGGEA